MTRTKHVIAGVALAAAMAGVTVGYKIRRASADGISSITPMYYAGTITDGAGSPLSGMHNLQLIVWDDPTSTSSTHLRCTTMASGVVLSAGRFRVPLDNTCTPVIHATPDLWVDVQLDGASIGRSKIGAVPFAVESDRAAGLTPSAAQSLVPPGTVIAFAGNTVPTGWRLCDGSALSRSAYATLFAAIGTLHGSGDGTTTFNLPDYRGRFLRGTDNASGHDLGVAGRTPASPGGSAGDSVGSLEAQSTALPVAGFTTTTAGAHSHGVSGYDWSGGTGGAAAGSFGPGSPFTLVPVGTDTQGAHTHTVVGGDPETRPANAAVNFIIKF
jgi:hypothetical protein